MQGDKSVQDKARHILKKTAALLRRLDSIERAHDEYHRKTGHHLLQLRKELEDAEDAVAAFEKQESHYLEEVEKSRQRAARDAKRAYEVARKTEQKEAQKTLERNAELEEENRRLRKQLFNVHDDLEDHNRKVAKASTLAIFDSIVAAIGNWSNDGQTAPDFELLLQSILFPIVYTQVMKGEEAYYVRQVPHSTLEIVRRGREFVKHFRAEKDVALTSFEPFWDEARAVMQEWLANDALPLIYGEGSEDWRLTPAISLEDMLKWRDQPASRALEFPLIWDGMELVSKMGDEIREHSGLGEFNKQTLSTRIEP